MCMNNMLQLLSVAWGNYGGHDLDVGTKKQNPDMSTRSSREIEFIRVIVIEFYIGHHMCATIHLMFLYLFPSSKPVGIGFSYCFRT